MNPNPAARQMVVISPSDLTFLYEQCKRCFQLKVLYGIRQPSVFPKVFQLMDAQQRAFFDGKPASAISTELPAGRLDCAATYLWSEPLSFPGTEIKVILRGTIDCHVAFNRGDHGIVDFKTTDPRDQHVSMYTRQLHAYAYAAEHPIKGEATMAPVSVLGLYCLSPVAMKKAANAQYASELKGTWMKLPRDDSWFMKHMKEVASVLDRSLFDLDPGCAQCQREQALRNLLGGPNTVSAMVAFVERVRDRLQAH